VKAIGEIGLDYYWEEDPAERAHQRDIFRAQLTMAQELELPVIVHDREAHHDTLEIVRQFPQVRGVFHCYAGSVEDAKVLVKLGWMLSFNGVITFKNARKAPEVIQAIPMEKLMIETDSPYLAPVPFRGKRNDSRNVHLVAEKIAALKGLTPEEVERITWENGKRFFGIE
jgi:TatD DNase family protein